ncbi:MAG: HD domain-containing protein, partial [Candidatus Margulisiibacteriota bacterium]
MSGINKVLARIHSYPVGEFNNKLLERAGIKAFEVKAGTPLEEIHEAMITLQLAGLGHHEKLINLQNNSEFSFVIDKQGQLHPFLEENTIQDKTIRDFVKTAIQHSFNQFFLGPSSTGGKYHPADEVVLAGLLHHTKRVAHLARQLSEILGLDQVVKDEIVAAAILHDICKSVTMTEEGKFEWGYHSVEDHSVVGAEWLKTIFHNYFKSSEYYQSLKDQEKEKAKLERVATSVFFHQNIWVDKFDTAIGRGRKNEINDWIVAISDITAGRSNIRVNYPGAPQKTETEILNELLDCKFETQSEYADNKDPEEIRKAIFLAEELFIQFEITEKGEKDSIIKNIR